MTTRALEITYIGGPTVLLSFGGIHFLTDPTFDPAGGEYQSAQTTLHKLSAPSIRLEELGEVDGVLLSHDHHFDNLDKRGRESLAKARKVITTKEGADRLGGNSLGLGEWESVDFDRRGIPGIRVIATPARHGPPGLDRGAVIGFALLDAGSRDDAVYVSGDTVWFEGVSEVARRWTVRAAVLHLGAARVPEVGPFHLTMTAEEGVEAARAFSKAAIVPVHFEGWAHFSEGRREIARAFEASGLEHRLVWPEAGRPVSIRF